ncbi:MAG: 2-amino-4-hydroxy-6-hydroxymethyldihydropteridine diphosphokinase [Synergistaceae bacterium]|nr:2-amino-4-hydroxy-6-hydroxymethyldihydropteridine diphosphokinase [Synergistaceae bacterium]
MNIYFGLGSNLGDRSKNMNDAVEKLKTLGSVVAVSKIYETKPWGGVEQPDFLNACVRVEREKFIEPLDLLKIVKNFENELGRVKSVRWGARKIDIDILLIDDMIYQSEELNIPHINLPDRLFVLEPLSEILPSGWRHPENNLSVEEMINFLRKSNS